MNDDPWDSLSKPQAAESVNAKRVSAEHPWNFFWGRDLDGKCLLILKHDTESRPRKKLPKLKGLDVRDSEWQSGDNSVLVLRLQETAHRDLFHQLCKDIIACAASAENEKEAVELTVARTWRWHYLLKGGHDDRLTPEQQKGLIGELLVLERHLTPQIGALSSVNSWQGPLGAPKDFELGQTFLEVKTKRGGAAPFTKISSEDQLDTPEASHLFLFVVDLDTALPELPDAFCLTDIAARIQRSFATVDQVTVDLLEQRLYSAGFLWTHDYSDSLWIEGESRFYMVSEGFPKITSAQLAIGIERVKYSLSLDACQPYQCEPEQLYQHISGTTDGNQH